MKGERLFQLIALFQVPSTAEAAAQRSGLSKPLVDGLLKQLQARGLVTIAEPGLGTCRPGCGACSMQNFCPKSDSDLQEDPTSLAINREIWRLTPLGEQTLERQKHPAN